MRIKLAIVVSDKNYLSRLSSTLDTIYADKLETYYFSDFEIALNHFRNGVRFDVLLADTDFEIDHNNFSSKVAFAYFSDSNDIETYRDKPCIGKYQKIDVIFREILRLYSENANNNVVFKADKESECSVVSVVSAAGGVGSSTIAAALAIRKQLSGMNVIYINFEVCGSTNIFFKSPGDGDFSNVIFALKSKKTNLAFKLNSEVKRSQEGVSFFDECSIALDKASLNFSECEKLIDELVKNGNYNLIIIDMDFSLVDSCIKILNKSDKVIFVSDGSELSNEKTRKSVTSIQIMESRQEELNLLAKSVLLYNKFSSKNSVQIDDFILNTIGGINRLEGLDSYSLAKKISEYGVFDNI